MTMQPTRNKPIVREYTHRPDNWSEITSYYNDHRKADGTIFRFKLNNDKVKSKMHWRTEDYSSTMGERLKEPTFQASVWSHSSVW